MCPKVQVAAVEKIIVKGEKGDIFYIITEGQVRSESMIFVFDMQVIQTKSYRQETGLVSVVS